MKKTNFLLISLLVVLLASCDKKQNNAPAAGGAPPQVDIMIIQPDTFVYHSETGGTILANEFVELRPEVNGRLIQLNIQEGTSVSAGSLIAKINDEDLQAQKKKIQAQLDIAEKTVQRLKKLLEANGLNQQEYDAAVSTRDGLLADIDLVNAQIRKTEIRAPFAGLIGLRNVSPGAYVTSTTVLATLQQMDQLKVDFSLPETEAADLRTGQSVEIKSETGIIATAVIRAIEPQINTGTRNIKFRAIVQGGGSAFQPGAFVNVVVSHQPDYNAILIPTNSIIPDSRTKKVALIHHGKVQFKLIETAQRTETSARVISGLNPGDSIAVTGLLFLKPEVPVTIRSVQHQSTELK
ncbi:MAG: efflux RND transporter periplasmic adaptor subunit [Flavobacteriales bacterium]|nr:efflux RND transporter periplasmic adaptor subunit [Flavobacteriales bacterium]